ncbi:MAG TPA: hypothetical protein VIX15_03985, partial [Streptosporangiaceae bacterium]
MRSDSATLRARLVLPGAVAGAVLVLLGAFSLGASITRRLDSKHPSGRIATLGLPVGFALIAAGLLVLLVCTLLKPRPSRRRSAHAAKPRSQADHQRRAAVSDEPDHERVRAGAPAAGRPEPDAGARSRRNREQVLNPTTVYSPGGLLDIPRDARAPESAVTPEGPWPQGTPGPYAPGPLGAQASQASQGRAGGPSRPLYQPGMP